MDLVKRNAAIIAMIAEYTKTNTAPKQLARAALVRSGIYTKKGQLRAEFSGSAKKTTTAA